MWGMGANARVPMRRRTRVPLVTWSQAAVDALQAHYWQLQDPASCERALYIYPWDWGLTSQMRDYSDAAIAAMGTGRTIHFVKDGRARPIYCAERGWLECFFKPMSGNRCRRSSAELGNTTAAVVPASPEDLVKLLVSDEPVLHVGHWGWVSFTVNASLASSVLPMKIWDQMVSTGGVQLWDTCGNPLHDATLRREDPELYHHLVLSALRTMLTPIMFRPEDAISKLAASRAESLAVPTSDRGSHCVAVHIRWTDKKDDGGVTAKLSFTVDHVATALERLERATSMTYRCVLLMSDDDEAAAKALRGLLGDAYQVKLISRVRDLFPSQAEYEIYRKKGHFHVRDYFGARDPAMALAYSQEVFVDIETAARTADYVIGPGSSGVSQLVAQYIGARRRMDANAVALWQEDVLRV